MKRKGFLQAAGSRLAAAMRGSQEANRENIDTDTISADRPSLNRFVQPKYLGVHELVDDYIYDTLSIVREGNYHFFGRPQEVKGNLETNQFVPNMLPNPQQFSVSRISCVFLREGKLYPLGNRLWSRTYLSLQIGTKPYAAAPAWMFAHPMVLFLHESESFFRLASAEQRNRLARCVRPCLNHTIHIRHEDFFAVKAEVQAPVPADTQLMVILEGERARAVW